MDQNKVSKPPKLSEIEQYEIYRGVGMTGETTRLADSYIQQLFALKPGEQLKIRDHYPSRDAHRRLFYLICRRMENEHPFALKKQFVIDRISIKFTCK